ncbi:MAG: low molecular weight protein-tyrosine-phosphatase [Sulfurimonadaceae bacterium]|nr:low molecular weight protein-tyrosine-phosphatase [Sulfurimonadaceae bacterium]
MVKSILFVCLGNICRSPLAEGIAKDLVKKHSLDIAIDSAGTSEHHIGEPPCANSIKVAKNHNIDISNLRARQVKKDDFSKFELVVALDSKNYSDLKAMGAKNLVKLGDFGFDGADVPDPYFFDGFDGFENVFNMIKKCVEEVVTPRRLELR